MADWIFLDHHTCSPPSKKLIEKWAKDANDYWFLGPIQKEKIRIFELLEGSNFDLHLTGNIHEAHFQVLFSHYTNFIRETGRTHILALESEKPTLLESIKSLEKLEVQAKILPVNAEGQLSIQTLQEAIRARSGLLSISWAQPFTGVIQPIADLIKLCRENEMQIHLDLTHVLGKLEVKLNDLDVDYITIDGALLHSPTPTSAIFLKKKIKQLYESRACEYAVLANAIECESQQIFHYAMEIGSLRNLLENHLQKLGGHLFFQDAERLPNIAVVAFEGIHSQQLLYRLKRQGIFATSGNGTLARAIKIPHLSHCGISFALSDETTREEILHVTAQIKKEIEEIHREKTTPFIEADARLKNMRVCNAILGTIAEGKKASLSLLVDEEDGVIADCKFDLFGSPGLQEVLEAVSSLLLRKNYMQAKRLSFEVIEKKMISTPTDADINFVLELIDNAATSCMDIPIDDIYMAPPEMSKGERIVYPNWETLTNEQKKSVISQVVERDIAPYVELDAGGVEVLKVEENRVTIGYSGNCTSCHSATGATLDSIGNILRHKIFPDLMVIPDISVLQH